MESILCGFHEPRTTRCSDHNAIQRPERTIPVSPRRRSRSVAPDFELNDRNAGAIAEICRRLDGLPLAIELAAARVRILSPGGILAKLDDRFRLLTGGNQGALARQRTLRATLRWSYDLLTPEERALFARLPLFAGGFTLEAATGIAGSDADEFDVMDRLTRLADRSLVLVEWPSRGDARYGLLETVREFGREELRCSGESDGARDRHLRHYLALAELAYSGRVGRDEHWARVLEREHDNLRAALVWARGRDPERHLELAGALARAMGAPGSSARGRGTPPRLCRS